MNHANCWLLLTSGSIPAPHVSARWYPDLKYARGVRTSFLQLWRLGRDADSSPTVQHMGSLIGGHTRTVNCIRFSPTGAVSWHSDAFVHPDSSQSACQSLASNENDHRVKREISERTASDVGGSMSLQASSWRQAATVANCSCGVPRCSS
jgi:hypothetical protein